jgi:hypothetical protein
MNDRAPRYGKKTAETCPNMTVFADVRHSDGNGDANRMFAQTLFAIGL